MQFINTFKRFTQDAADWDKIVFQMSLRNAIDLLLCVIKHILNITLRIFISKP